MGEMLALKKPTPIPKKIKPTEKQPRAPLGCFITGGSAEMMIIRCPNIATTIATWIVLYFPQYESET